MSYDKLITEMIFLQKKFSLLLQKNVSMTQVNAYNLNNFKQI
jgi:hypothetical protein